MIVLEKKTPKYNHSPIDMHLIAREEFKKPGDFYWKDGDGNTHMNWAVMWVAIPSTTGLYDGSFDVIRIQCASEQAPKFWQWDGNLNKPTLSPSIHVVGIWHGWIKNGQLIEA